MSGSPRDPHPGWHRWSGRNDLTVTFADGTVAAGDVVVARGTVALDQDFGAGYKYDVMIENATVGAK